MQKSKTTQAPQSKKKRNAEKNLKNIIALPYEKFWPLVEGEDKTRILGLLQRLLVKLRQEKQVPRQLLQGKTVEEQKQIKKSVRAEWEAKEEYKEAAKIRSQLLLGVNAVSKGLQNGVPSACLVSGDAEPQMIMKHLLHSAAASRVPVLVISSLKEFCHSNAGFSCLALAIKKEEVDGDPTLTELVQIVSDVSSRFELPVSLQTLVAPPPVSVETPETKPQQKPKFVTSQQVKALHLSKPLNGRPAFVPASRASAETKADFISLGSKEECGTETQEPVLPLRPSPKKKSSYQPLVVKRLQPNPDKVRNKKKKSKGNQFIL